MAQPSWDELREQRDRILRDQGTAHRESGYGFYGSTQRKITCPDCGRSGEISIGVNVEDVTHADDEYPDDEAPEEEMEDYESGQPEWRFVPRWTERDPSDLDADALQRALSEIASRQRDAALRVERLTGYRSRIEQLLAEAEHAAPKPAPRATKEADPDKLPGIE